MEKVSDAHGTENIFLNGDRLSAVLSWIHAVLLFTGLYLVEAGILRLDQGSAARNLAGSIWLFVPVISSWYLIRRSGSFFLYAAAGTAVTAATAFLSGSILTAVLSVVIFLIRCYVRVIRGHMQDMAQGEAEWHPQVELWEIPTVLDSPKVRHSAVLIVCYFVLIFLEQSDFLPWLFWLLLAEGIICHISNSLANLKQFILEKRRVANLPVKTIRHIGIAVLCGTLLLMVLFLMPAVLYGEEPLTGMVNLLRGHEYEAELPPMPGMEMGGDGMQDMLQAIAEESYREPPAWLATLLDIIMYVAVALTVIACVLMVFHFFRRMMRSFAKGEEEDEIIFLGGTSEDGIFGVRRKKTGAGRSSPNMKIRKKYKRTIMKQIQGSPSGFETPDELEEKAGLREQEELQYFHETYEKARYGYGECSREEAEHFGKIRMKN